MKQVSWSITLGGSSRVEVHVAMTYMPKDMNIM